jgi:hypothetical protein
VDTQFVRAQRVLTQALRDASAETQRSSHGIRHALTDGKTRPKGATMNKIYLTTAMVAGLALAGVGWATAQTPATGHDHTAPAKAAPAKAGPGVPPPGEMGKMGGGHGMCPMMGGEGMGSMGSMPSMGGGMGTMMNMGGAGTQVAIKNIDKGVTITLTATDPSKAVRLQKMAEAMRLMHEATAQ